MSETTQTDQIVNTMKSVEAEWLRASRSLAAVMPKEIAGAINLMVHPAAVASATTIVGVSAATQATRLWMGAWLGAVENMQRVMATSLDAVAEPGSWQAARRARSTTETLIADAKSLADEIAKPSGRPSPTAVRAKKTAASAASAREAVTAGKAPAMPAAMAKPAKPDDLKAISGVGPKLEQVLNGLGVWTYGQIAALTSAEIDWIEDYLSFNGRVGRDDWLGQAAKLAADRSAKL